jgi:hypothetical protein
MAEGFNFERLRSAILPLSSATSWTEAKKEWSLVGIEQADPDEPETCLCGHHPILELCEIRNRLTRHTRIVGNQCVKRFLGLDSEALFRGLRRIKKDDTKSMGADLAVWLYEHNRISEWEYNFQSDTGSKRKLTGKQMLHRRKINQKALAAVLRRGITIVE